MGNRDVAEILAYHEATKHSVASVHGDRHGLDWAIMPRPFKVYPTLEPLPLPRDFSSTTRPTLAAIADAGDRGDAAAPLDRTALARLLYFSAGVLRRRRYAGGELFFRAAACTGALYHIDLYLVAGRLPDLEAGVYHFSPHDFALRRLRAGDHRRALVEATGDEPAAATAPALVVCTDTFWRNAWKYRARAYRHGFWDSGTILANLLGLCAASGVAARVVLGFADDAVNALCGVDGTREAALAVVALGRDAPAPPAAAPAPPLDLETLPYSSREVHYPAIARAHAASSLSTPKKAAAWRGAPSARVSPAAPPSAVPLRPRAFDEAVREPLEPVILRRGSTRQFARTPIGFADFSTLLVAATRGIPADFTAPGAPTTDVYVVANAVDGLEPGAYALDRARTLLVPIRRGDFRRQAGHLGLGQALSAEAAADVFWLTDLGPVLERFGNRGYRAAQLEGGIEGGKAYLAAYALGMGATGLTFFDDDVTRFFSPHAAGKSVLFLAAVGAPVRAARRSTG